MRTTASLLGLAVMALASVLGAPAEAQVASPPTFSKDVAPVLYKHCVTCHRPGEVARTGSHRCRTRNARSVGIGRGATRRGQRSPA
jgi:hypothetical protein